MLKLFSTRPDSPLSDDKERRRILAELATMEAPAAVREVADWLDALHAEDGFSPEDRYTILCELDDAAAAAIRALTREFFTSTTLPRGRAQDYWQRASAAWQGLGAGYARCLDLAQHDPKGRDLARRQLAPLCLRLVRTHGQWLKWSQFHHGPLDPALWLHAGAAFLAAEQGGLARKALAAPGGGASSVYGEYLRLVALQASSLDRLRPLQIELADRLVGHLIDALALSPQADPSASWWIDPARPMPPVRLARAPVPSPTLHFLSVKEARAALQALVAALERDILPPELDLGAPYAPKVVLPVMRHLARYWAATPPKRLHARHAIRSALRSVSGLEKVSAQVSGCAAAATESQIEDVSRGGFSVRARAADEAQLQLGALVALQPEGGDNWLVGIVRRVARQPDGSLQLGVETLSHRPAAVEVGLAGSMTPAVLLDPLERGAEVRLVLPQYAYEDHAVVTLEHAGVFAELEPAGLVETGEDCDLARYRVARLSGLS